MERFKFISFTVTHKRFLTHIEKIIQCKITNSSLPTFTVELMPVKAIRDTSKFHSFS